MTALITSSLFLIALSYFYAEDPVYMENEDRRREYVLNDVGKIYIGSHSKPKGRKWIYGQVMYSLCMGCISES